MLLRLVGTFEEVVECGLARRDCGADAIGAGGPEEVALLDQAGPALDLVQVGLDLLRFGCRDVAAKELELDLPQEFRLALLHDLGVFV